MTNLTRRIRIEGRVQGVFFRDWTVRTARELGVNGWVRNRADGSVETLAGGPAAAIDMFVERCRSGPDRAQVSALHVAETEEDAGTGFIRKGDA